MKRFTKGSSQKMSMHFKKGVPADINQKFLTRRVDAAFISSIKARKFNNIGLGIVAKKEVLSVLVIPDIVSKKDKESATSNVLAQVLDIKGEVLIGDKALKYYLSGAKHIDLAKVWHKKHQLPFVFALLCYHKDQKLYKRIKTNFLRSKVKIPQYILQEASQRTGIEKKEILHYLEYISYEVDLKAKRGLKKFYQKVDNL
jgi:chorismate dehydratase